LLILTRDPAITVLNSVTIAPIASTIRSIPTEVILTKEDGHPHACAAKFDNLDAVPKGQIGENIAQLSPHKIKQAKAPSRLR
jgi:mRNA interferase MazF